MTAREELGDKVGATLVDTGDTPLFTTDNMLMNYSSIMQKKAMLQLY